MMSTEDSNQFPAFDTQDFDDYQEPAAYGYCDSYQVHAAHHYTALNGGLYQCSGMTQHALDELIEQSSESCEHGLAAWLCAGPNHYPADNQF